MRKVKKVLTFIIDAVCVIIIIAAIFALLTVVLNRNGNQTGLFGFHAFRVLSGSMEPEIPVDSLVIVREVNPSEIRENDVITFYSRDPELQGSANTHRVTAVREENGYYSFTTKGDANLLEDRYAVLGSDLIGRVVFVSFFAGKALRLVSNPIVFAAVVIIPLLVMMILNMKDVIVTARKATTLELAEALEAKAAELDPDLVGRMRRSAARAKRREKTGWTAEADPLIARARLIRLRSVRSDARKAGIESRKKKAVRQPSRAKSLARIGAEREAFARRRAFLASAAAARMVPAVAVAAPAQKLKMAAGDDRLRRTRNQNVNAARASAKASYTRPSASSRAGRRR